MEQKKLMTLILSTNFKEWVDKNPEIYNKVKSIYKKCKLNSGHIYLNRDEKNTIAKIKMLPAYISEQEAEIEKINYKVNKITTIACYIFGENILNLKKPGRKQELADFRAMIWGYACECIEYSFMSKTDFYTLLGEYFNRKRCTVINALKNCDFPIKNEFEKFKKILDQNIN